MNRKIRRELKAVTAALNAARREGASKVIIRALKHQQDLLWDLLIDAEEAFA